MIKRTSISVAVIFLLQLYCPNAHAQEAWPRVLQSKDGGSITLYQPQPEKLEGNVITGRTAVSVKLQPGDEPVFGALWFTAVMETNRNNRMAELLSIKINNVKIPGIEDTSRMSKLKKYLETEAPKWNLKVTLDDIAAAVEEEQQAAGDHFNNAPPQIIYTTKSSVLVSIDGEPKLEDDDGLKMKRVINSAFLIVQNPKDQLFYLYGGIWYSSNSIKLGWKPVKTVPKELQQIDKQLKEQGDQPTQASTTDAGEIIVVTAPAELIQSKGEASFSAIKGTSLLYVSNSDNDIFMDINTNKYYILVSGRWYMAASLKGTWNYIASDQLPADFAKIPRGSDKDAVLASVAGTDEAHDAVMDAQIPQTAKVDRSTATCTVTYDGDPKFEKIEGTSLYIAKNTSGTVLKSGNSYYCVENAIWFKAASATGPWKVSDDRPKDVDNIPASSEAYNVKYVYIYETSPQYVYVGYTPGYLGCYVYGPVVVYGTGYYYNPWYGPYYYPRPVTYGFSVHYNPFTGWGIGFHYSTGYFSFHYYRGFHGYWGPPVYRPPYYPRYHGGMYGGRGPVYIGGDVNINVGNRNNIYVNQKGVSTRDIKRSAQGNKTMPANNNKNVKPGNTGNNIITDRDGNLFKQDAKGDWQQLGGKDPQPASNNATSNLNKQIQNRERSAKQNNNFNQASKSVRPAVKQKKQ